MTRIISIGNQKGGVGKTTTAINLSAALSERNKKVLLVDLDPQGHATEGLGLKEKYEIESPNLAKLLVGKSQDLKKAIYKAENFYLLPSNLELFVIEKELINLRARELRLKNMLKPLEGEYDYILIDCPPNLGIYMDNALLASNEILIPIQAEDTSIRALELLMDQIQALETAFEVYIKILAIVPNLVQDDSVSKKTLESLKGKLPLTDFTLRKRVDLKKAWREGKSIFRFKPNLDMVANYRKLADIVEHGGVKNG